MKRADKLIQSTRYTREENPAITALVDFASQNPGLDPNNYFDPAAIGYDRRGYFEGRRAFHYEKRSITADYRRFRLALAEASAEGVTDQDVIAEAPHAFSGRLGWGAKQHHDHKTGEYVGAWSYCTGQYFPTEYRKAAATLLEYATRKVRGSRPPAKRMPRTIAELKALNRENGGCWFSRDTMRFFDTRIESGILKGRYFITSEASETWEQPRRYSVRSFDEKGDIDTVGDFHSYRTRAEAIEALETELQPA